MDRFKLVRKEDSSIRNHNDKYSIKNYLTKEFNKDFSLAVSDLRDGKHELTKNIVSDRIYYFIEADARFNIEGKEIKVSNEDVLFIPKNTEYSFSGTFKAVLINIPAFGVEYEKQTELD